MMVIIIIIILYVSSKHAKRCRIWICNSGYYKEKLIILDIKDWNTFRCNGSHKYFEFISCLCMTEQNSEAFDEISWDPSIPRSGCSNISCLYFHGHIHGLDCGCGHAKNHDCGHGHK